MRFHNCKNILTKWLYDAKKDAVRRIKQGRATCVVVRDGQINSAESPRGISYVIALYEQGKLQNAFVADKIIGKAAAMIFTLGGVRACYGETVSKSAASWLVAKGVSVEYGHLVERIQNRQGNGVCPMESTVAHINDETEALAALKRKVDELRKQTKN